MSSALQMENPMLAMSIFGVHNANGGLAIIRI
jgi:hypothetical protein